jgi:NADH pyrophosphatase NudC (nudix superfamily)
VPVVVVLAATGSGKVLYTRHVGWPPGHWGLISGYVEQGETVEEAALREVREESSLEPRNPRVVGSSPWRNELIVCVAVEIDEGVPTLGGESGLEAVELAEADAARIPDTYPAHHFLAAWVAERPPTDSQRSAD